MNNLHQIPEDFQNYWKRIAQRWRATTLIWNDKMRRRFEKEFWANLELESSNTHVSMVDLVKIMTEARRRVR